MTISRAGKMPRFARVLKKASLFCGCNVCEKAQNSLTKFTCRGKKNRYNGCSAFHTFMQAIKVQKQKHYPQADSFVRFYSSGKINFWFCLKHSIYRCKVFPKLNKWQLHGRINWLFLISLSVRVYSVEWVALPKFFYYNPVDKEVICIKIIKENCSKM